jgi:hypothetical protein
MRIVREFKDPCEWHSYFAWFPICIKWSDTEFQWAWLETIETRKKYSWYDSYYEYRFKVRKEE